MDKMNSCWKHDGWREYSVVLSGRGIFYGTLPDTSCLANFRLSLPGRLFAEAGAQIFFQTGEGGFKGVVVLPVGKIGEVIFADFFRQTFTKINQFLL